MTTQYLVGPTRTYTTLSAALNVVPSDLSGTGIHEIIMDAATYSLGAGFIDIQKSNGSASNYIWIHAAAGAEHKGNPTVGVIFDRGSFTTSQRTLTAATDYTVISDIVISEQSGAGNNQLMNVSANNCTLSNVFVYSWSSRAFGISGSDTTLICCFAIARNANLNKVAFDIAGSIAGRPTKILNCGMWEFNSGISSNGSEGVQVKNTWHYHVFVPPTTGFMSGLFGSCSNNASNEFISIGSNNKSSLSLAQFAFVNSGSSNFHILSTSQLYNTGANLSSAFVADVDLETIFYWCIGPDCFAGALIAPRTSSSPFFGEQTTTNVPSASLKGIQTQSSAAPDGLGKGKQTKDARTSNIKTLSPVASPGLKGNRQTASASSSQQRIKAGLKNGFISIIPERDGFNGSQMGTGNRVGFYSELLESGKGFAQLQKAGAHRTDITRVPLYNTPKGKFTIPFRGNDCVPMLMSHFQNRYGTTPATGTTYYEFYSNKGSLTLDGSNFSSGSYLSGAGDAFTVSVFKALNGSGYLFKSGICDSLTFQSSLNDEFVAMPEYVFSSVSLVGTSALNGHGSYSRLSGFAPWSSSINFLGLDVVGFQFKSANNLKQISPAGTYSAFYKFGKNEITGRVAVDVNKSALAYIGTMLNGSSFSVYGTYFNSDNDKLIFQMPYCRLDNFNFSVGEHDTAIPFRAYESEDGTTPALKLMLWTTGYSATTFEPN